MDSSTPKGLVPFLVGMMLLTGVCNTLLTKYQDMVCLRDCDTPHPNTFEQPVIQTLQMFVGESGCWLVVLLSYLFSLLRARTTSSRRDGVAYQPLGGRDSSGDDSARDEEDEDDEEARLTRESEGMTSSQTLVDATNVVAKPILGGEEDAVVERRPLKGWKVTLLALPAVCDICGTTLMNAGLLFVAASIYQMTRGALVLFVGLFSVVFLKRHLSGWKWASLVIVVLGVAVVGLASVIENGETDPHVPGQSGLDGDRRVVMQRAVELARDTVGTLDTHSAAQSIIGVSMIAGAQIFTASQFVLEESIMERYSMDPIQVVGWEGVFGFSVTLVGMGVLHLVIGTGYFDARQAFYEVFTNRAVAVSSVLIMISIGGFNFFGLSVTRVISATARSTIDTCRTLFIWIVSLGLGWETFKWLQVLGFAMLVWGTALFNDIVNPPTIAFLRRRRRQYGILSDGGASQS